ncbi:MAG: ribosome-associated translation inhibitor RaiA [Bacteroidetes bacterium]|nr:ribosome-associated translation inhibitor RaiA [Bacteroidota bacterium]MCH8169819.1 ribosome-associated translation inhibitor RaiA [Bacteroidota bacterium]MCH8941575.1 ribosome-associated translation inhibitor RaiA [Bacteroidota bacterium]
MNIKITARKFKAHQTLKDFISDEVSSLQKFYDNIMNAEIILSYIKPNKSVKNAEIIIQVPGQTLKAKEESNDFSKSVAVSVNKLKSQLKKFKSKQIAH